MSTLLILFTFLLPVLDVSAEQPLVVTLSSYSFQNGKPYLLSNGIQYNSTNAFVTELNQGRPSFFTTIDQGKHWNAYVVNVNGKTASLEDGFRVYGYRNGFSTISLNGLFYSSSDGKRFLKCNTTSISMRGEDGFRTVAINSKSKPILQKTVDGGISWCALSSNSIPFTRIESFDIVNVSNIYACVSVLQKNGHFKHCLAASINGGFDWNLMLNDEKGLNIWPSHVFFLSKSLGWISSDRDDGLFKTANGGATWVRIETPINIISAIFFKDVLNGRIIDGAEGVVYQTSDAGLTWKLVEQNFLQSDAYLKLFEGYKFSRWNDFAIHKMLSSVGSLGQPIKHTAQIVEGIDSTTFRAPDDAPVLQR